MSSIRTQEQLFAISRSPQVDALTPNTAGQLIRLGKLNSEIAFPDLSTEDDAAEMGKGDEFATQQYAVSWNTSGSIKKYLTSQIAMWAYTFGMGSSAYADAYTVTAVPQDPQASGIELPYFSCLQQMRPNQVGGAPLDQLIIGCAIEEVMVNLNSGPGRQATQITVNFQGCGKFVEPSGYTMPLQSNEVQLQSSSASVLINGIDYIAQANRGNLVSLQAGVKNNIDPNSGFFIGSGNNTPGNYQSGAVRGRLEFTSRVYSLSLVVRLSSTSAEFRALRMLQTGTASVALAGGPTDGFNIMHPRVGYNTVTLSDTNNMATLQINTRILKDPALGPIVVSAQNSTIAGIGTT